VTVDNDLTVTDVNDQMIRLTGYTREELVGSPFKDYFTEPLRAAAGVRQTLAEGSVTNYELILKSKGGKRTVVSFNAGTFRDTAGRVAGILAAARDITAQKRLQEQLRDQQNYNRSLIEASVDALMTVDPNGIITDVNEQTAKLYGYNRKQLVGSPFVDYFTDAESARAGVRKTFDEGVVTNYELVVRTKAGRKTPVSFNAAVFRDASGEVQGILAAARDITQQKQIEQELREQQTYTRGLIESNIDALMTTDTLGVITDVNVQMCEITGRTREELIGTPFKSFFTDAQRAEDGIRQVLTDDRVTNYELTIRAKDGKETVVSYNATTFKGADGRLRGVFAAARDITEQKRLEGQIARQYREVAETTTFLNNILESSTEYSIIAKDLSGSILAWNEGARRTYGYGAEEMIGKQNSRILHTPADIESGRVDEALHAALTTGKFEGEFQRLRKNGEQFTAQVAITLRSDTAGKPIGFLLISKDITEQKALEEQLRKKNEELSEQYRRVQEANRLKSEFLANMSHELRTPLNAIIGFSELMHDGKVGPVSTEHQEYLGDILSSSRHLLQLINDVLDLAKVEAGKTEFHHEPVDLEQVFTETRDVLRALASKKRIVIEATVDPSIGDFAADPAKLKQVLYNYLSNALKFTDEGGRVRLSARHVEGDMVRFDVADSGIGIRPQDMDRLFVEFQQLDASTAKKYQGTGLGLALTKRIIEAQGGRVGVESVAGKGSTFFAILPRRGGTPAIPMMVSAERAAPVLGGGDILVVEDRPEEQRLLTSILTAAGHSVVVAVSGAEAIRCARDRRFDAITLDLQLGDIEGSEVLNSIRAEGPNQDTPVLVVSVLADSVAAGGTVQAWLQKPIRAERLVQALRGAGVSRSLDAPILVVDDDPATLKLAETTLRELGHRVITRSDAAGALMAAREVAPAAVVLDLAMPGMDGFMFLQQFRRMAAGRSVPVIVWTNTDVSGDDRSYLETVGQSIVAKAGGLETLVQALETWVPRGAAGVGRMAS